MTTAHRPTWKAAVGRAQEGGWTAGGAVSTQISALDVASHTKLKTRQGDQVIDQKEALKESLLALEKAESKAVLKSKIGRRLLVESVEQEGRQKLLKQTADVDDLQLKSKYDDEDADDGDGGGNDSDGWSDVDRGNLDADDDSDLDASDSDEDDDDSDSDDEDEEAALQAELTKIRAEREASKDKAESEAAAEEESKLGEAAMIGNPLLTAGDAADTSGKMKRRWNDDVVFRNQAKGEPKLKKRFINDTIRNDFHKRFLNKFIR